MISLNWTPSNKSRIAKAWFFNSKSNPNRPPHETRLYEDGTTSCNCPGWTRHTDDDGYRTCTHVTSVENGTADQKASTFTDYSQSYTPRRQSGKPTTKKAGYHKIADASKPKSEPKPAASPLMIPVVRKIQW